MSLVSLTVTDFRNLASAELAVDGKLTCLVGDNGQGKTSLLEALGLLTFGKSFRSAPDALLVREGQLLYRVRAQLADGTTLEIAYQMNPTEKRVRLNGQKSGVGRLLGQLPAVIFQPSDLLLLTGEPALRRKYLDVLLCQVSPDYLQAAGQYGRALRQRNALLTKIALGEAKESELEYWDRHLAETGTVICVWRQAYLAELTKSLPVWWGKLCDKPAELTLSLTGQAAELTPAAYLAELEASQAADLRSGRTSYGPHRQDLVLELTGSPVHQVASRGELRSLTIALKLAELEYLRQTLGRQPVLLLDDVFSELDAVRRKRLLELIAGTQSIITTTDLSHLGAAASRAKVLKVEAGQLHVLK